MLFVCKKKYTAALDMLAAKEEEVAKLTARLKEEKEYYDADLLDFETMHGRLKGLVEVAKEKAGKAKKMKDLQGIITSLAEDIIGILGE